MATAMSKRDYLRSIGFDVKDRGKFSGEMHMALEKAPAGSWEEAVVEPKTPRKKGEAKPSVNKPDTPYEPAAVRKWANENGHNLPARGKIPYAVIHAYLDGNSAETVAQDIVNPDAVFEHIEPFRRGIRYEGEHNGKRIEVGGANVCYTHTNGSVNPSLDYCPGSEPHEITMGSYRVKVTPMSKG